MGTPVATPTDLQTFLGLSTIDSARATLILLLAQNLCEGVLTPLPATANAVVLDVAARAFVNPQAVQAESAGPFHVQFGAQSAVGGLFLTRANKANLRRLNGAGGAFSIDPLPKGVSAVQLVTVGGTPTGGTFTLSFVNQVSGPIPFNATAQQVQTALTALSAVGAGNVTVTGSGPYTVTFSGVLATTPVPTLGADPSGLTGGVSPSVAVTVVTKGVLAAGQGLAPWDFDYYDHGGTSQYVPGGFV
jgi:hypothetical protein